MCKKIFIILLCCLLACPACGETVQDQALAFFQEAGVPADSVNRIGDEIIVQLPGGGTAALYCPGDFDPLNLDWRFTGATDGELACYLDHALGLLAALEGRIPADLAGLPDAQVRQAQSLEAMVSNGLLALEKTGSQGLDVLLSRLAAHDNSGLNSLRARLASRLLGRLDATPVDPAQGLAWYDALTIAVQDDLPRAAPAAYAADPFLAEVTGLLIAHEEAGRAGCPDLPDADGEKAATFVYLSAVTTRTEGDAATVLCHMISEKIALYDGTRIEVLSGTWAPRRIDLIRQDGAWRILQVHQPGDGTDYWPSIVDFCDGDEALAASLTQANTPALHEAREQALHAWLASAGYPHFAGE